MTKQVKNLKHLQSEIDSALSLIKNKGSVLNGDGISKKGLITGTESLLERCRSIVIAKQKAKPSMRTIHHFACSGGTLISKCISSMPNVFLLSEIHPYTQMFPPSGKPLYLPTDIVSQIKYAKVPLNKELSLKLFTNNIVTVSKHLRKIGGTLIIREHTHSEYCLSDMVHKTKKLISCLSSEFNIESIVTIRDPIDSYSSLVKNNWVTFNPQSFDEYCKRYLCFLEDYADCSVFKYEDFVEEPIEQVKNICKSLKVEFCEDFLDIFPLIKLSGDSGRTSDSISFRKNNVPSYIKNEALKSSHYHLFCERFNYRNIL